VAGDHPVTVHRGLPVSAAGGDKAVDLQEGPLVEEEVEALAGGQFALGVLGGEAGVRRLRGRRRAG
jgi:hypothetical protein